jgi:hypothetical protein
MRVLVLGVVMLFAGILNPSSARAAGPYAVLDHGSIPLTTVHSYYCHDLEFPRISCFRTSSDLRADEATVTSSGVSILSATALPYVRIFQDASFTGPWTDLSQNYDNLGSIGWNDRISSIKSLNSTAGNFWTDAVHSGWLYSFAAGAWVYYVGDAWNDHFSSVYRA